jgi:hypothetical protein
MAPEISVSRLDVLKLSDPEKFATGSFERIKAKRSRNSFNFGPVQKSV